LTARHGAEFWHEGEDGSGGEPVDPRPLPRRWRALRKLATLGILASVPKERMKALSLSVSGQACHAALLEQQQFMSSCRLADGKVGVAALEEAADGAATIVVAALEPGVAQGQRHLQLSKRWWPRAAGSLDVVGRDGPIPARSPAAGLS
jgi:hypothetical protein